MRNLEGLQECSKCGRESVIETWHMNKIDMHGKTVKVKECFSCGKKMKRV